MSKVTICTEFQIILQLISSGVSVQKKWNLQNYLDLKPTVDKNIPNHSHTSLQKYSLIMKHLLSMFSSYLKTNEK